MNSSTFKAREKEAGKAVELVPKVSFQHFLSLERGQAIENGPESDQNNLVSVLCSYDMGWQKWGRGYNLTTGHAAVTGLSTGKMLDYTAKHKTCRCCSAAKEGRKNTKTT